MIDSKFKDLLNISRVPDPTPEQILSYIKMRNREEEMEQALKDGNAYMFGKTLRTNKPETNATFTPPGSTRMRNSVLFGNTFANTSPKTNATFMPPKPGSMYDNMVSPDDINDIRRNMMKTQANIALINNPLNPMFNRPDRPNNSALLDDVNANNAAANILMGRNINKEAVADNLQKTIKDVDAREKEKRIAKRKERFEKLRRFGLALSGKDPDALDAKQLMQMIDMQYKTALFENMGLKSRDRKEIIDFARQTAETDPNLSEIEKNSVLNNDAVAFAYGTKAAKGGDPEDKLNTYISTGTMSPSAFTYLQQNIDKFQDNPEGKQIKDILSKSTYQEYVQSEQQKNQFNSLLRRQSKTADPELNRYIEGSLLTGMEADALNFAQRRRFLDQYQ